MTERRSFSLRDKFKVMARQARCPLCGLRMEESMSVQLDHITPLALGGADELENLQAVHKHCHLEKTSGRRGESKLSIRDGDQGKIAKVRRLILKGSKPKKPSTKWPKRKLESRSSFRRRDP